MSIARNIDDGSDVLAAATLTSEQLAIGEVNGLPVVTLTPSAVRSIWYAAPLVLLVANDAKPDTTKTTRLIEPKSFEEIKEICTTLKNWHESARPTVLKIISKLTKVSLSAIAKFQKGINLIAEGSEPNDAFKYQKD